MQKIASDELKTRLSEVLDSVEHGQTIIVTRHGKPIARILPNTPTERERVRGVVQRLKAFPRTRLPKGVTIRGLIEEGRH